MKRNYVPTTLDQYINESKQITLKRGYRGQNPVVVGANAPIRNQVLSYVAEGQRVAAADLKRFVAGLNETNANPNAAANMWLRRNGKFFVTESKGGVTYFKLSKLGQRLVNRFTPAPAVNEAKDEAGFKAWVKEQRKKHSDWDAELGEVEGKDKYKKKLDAAMKRFGMNEAEVFEKKKFDFKDPKTDKPGIIDKEKEDEEVEEGCSKTHEAVEPGAKAKPNLGGKLDPKLHNLLTQDQDKDESEIAGFEKEITEGEGISPERRERIEKLIENIRAKKDVEKLNEAEEEEVEGEVEDEEGDELSFDDLDLSGEGGESGGSEEEEGEEESEEHEEEESEEEEAEEHEDDDDEKVEITEFIITVDDVDSAIEELKELGVDAEKVLADDSVNEAEEGEGEDVEVDTEEDVEVEDDDSDDEEGKYKDDEISVPAEQWDALKGWLEDKGVDVEEMFGGEIEVEDMEDEDEMDLEGGEGDDLEVDLEGGEGDDLEVDLEGEGGDELELDLGDEGEPEVEESLTGMENHEKDTNNLITGAKQVVITYK